MMRVSLISASKFAALALVAMATYGGSFIPVPGLTPSPAIAQVNSLPDAVAQKVIQRASRQSGFDANSLQIRSAQRETWPNGCLGLREPGEVCTQANVRGWRVVVVRNEYRWVFRTDNDGDVIKLDRDASQIPPGALTRLPNDIEQKVIQRAARQSGLNTSSLKVTGAQQDTWPNGCLGLGDPGEACTQARVPGWRVVVTSNQYRWVYRTDKTGDVIKLDRDASQIPPNAITALPNDIEQKVIQRAARQSGLNPSSLKVSGAQRETWPDSCLGLGGPNESCLRSQVRGWRVVVTSNQYRWVYRTDNTGDVIRLDREASQLPPNQGLQPVSIPSQELPPAIAKKAIFREIRSGGIAGQTITITLFENGKIERTTNRGQSQTLKVSRQQAQRFEQLLREQNFAKYDRLSYPGPRGSADTMTITLSSKQDTTRYVDIVQNQLPSPLKTVIQSWQQVLNQARATSADDRDFRDNDRDDDNDRQSRPDKKPKSFNSHSDKH